MIRRAAAFTVLLAATLIGCGDDDDPDADDVDGEGVHAAEVLSTAIRDVVARSPVDPEREDEKPVVFVVGVGENGIAAGVQADVATGLRDEIDVRFADTRDEAIDGGAEDAPVVDDGLLLLVSAIPEEGDQINVAIERYRSESDRSKAVFMLAMRGEEWAVTATSLVALETR